MGTGIFFDRAHFGVDRMVSGYGVRPWADFFAEVPMSATARADLLRLHTDKRDWLPGLSPKPRPRRSSA
jgi:spermidine dehydrogenase